MSLFRSRSTPRCYGELMAEAAADGHDSPEAAAAARREAKANARAEAALDRADNPEPDDIDPGPWELPDRLNDRR